MLRGDISNESERLPRTLVVWEGYLALPTDLQPTGFTSRLLRRQPTAEQVIGTYILNLKALDLMWDIAWRKGWRFEMVTFLGDDAAGAITTRMSETFYDFGPVLSTTPGRLSREISHFPDIVTVCDPDPDHSLTYGGRGLHVSPERPTFRR